MDQCEQILKQQERAHASSLLKKHGLICKQMQYGEGPAPLYIAKPTWTNRFDERRDSTVGIFCAIWISKQLLEEGQFAYNIHSKAIRELPGYELTSKKFATDFRQLVAASVASWPNISIDHGPTTLLSGTDTCELDSFAKKVEERISGFVDIHQHVDSLLGAALS